jgi:hypothetical protein
MHNRKSKSRTKAWGAGNSHEPRLKEERQIHEGEDDFCGNRNGRVAASGGGGPQQRDGTREGARQRGAEPEEPGRGKRAPREEQEPGGEGDSRIRGDEGGRPEGSTQQEQEGADAR